MNSYNNKIVLAEGMDVILKANTNIFTVSNGMSDIFNSFLAPNITRKLGSYVIFDNNSSIYGLCGKNIENYGYKIEKINLNSAFNVFACLNSEIEIQRLVKAALRNCTEIQRYLYEGKTEVDLLYTQTDLILTLILIHIIEKTPIEKRCFSYINKILNKLQQNNIDYFKKYFEKVDSSYMIQSSIFHLDYMKEEEYKKSLSLLSDVLSNVTDTKMLNSTAISSIESLYAHNEPKLIFIELTGISVIDSYFCSYIEETCPTNTISSSDFPVFYVYAPLETIGFIPNFVNIFEESKKTKNIHILIFNSIATAIKLYGRDIRKFMKKIPYGLIFQKNKEKNIEFTEKLLSDDTISDLMKKIQNNPGSIILYRKQKGISIEQKIHL